MNKVELASLNKVEMASFEQGWAGHGRESERDSDSDRDREKKIGKVSPEWKLCVITCRRKILVEIFLRLEELEHKVD